MYGEYTVYIAAAYGATCAGACLTLIHAYLKRRTAAKRLAREREAALASGKEKNG